MAEINWGLLDTQYPQKLSDLFNPASIQARQAAVSDQQIMNQLRQAQLMQAAQGIQRQPELTRREDVQYQAQQADAARKKLVMGVLRNPNSTPEQKRQALVELFPEKAAEAAFKPPAAPIKVSPGESVLGPDNKPLYTAPGKPVTDMQRGQIVFDQQGRAFNVNPYTNEVRAVKIPEGQIQGAQYSPSLQGQIAGAKASGKETGQATGESVAKLQDIEAMLPRLETVVSELSDLGKKATYTMAGQGTDIARRQLGMNVGPGAIARKEYISKVDNEILPLLRQTFGAQFTQKEGESLKATLGDPNASPEEKDAVLKSFIDTKYGQIAGLRRRTGAQPSGTFDADKEARYQAWKAQQGR